MPEKAVSVSKNNKKYKKGELLFSQNDATQELFVVKSGKIRIFKKTTISEIDLDIAGPGAVIGEISISHQKH